MSPSHPPTRPSLLSARVAELYGDTQQCAAVAGLVYITGDEPGISRHRHGRGFGYRGPDNRPLSDRALKERIIALAIPPAWRNVWICPDDSGHIVAVGEDDRGRKQYIYHERWRELRDMLNFYRLISFAEHLPAIRDHVDTQLRRRTLDRDQVLAAMLRIIDATAIRIGNEVYAEENESFGLTTLTRKHVLVSGDTVTMTFRAKSGKQAEIGLTDRQVARVISALAQQRRRRLFTVDGAVIDAADLNALLAELTHEHITAKDFRTWRGTHAAFAHLEQAAEPGAHREAVALHAADAAAEVLGNTRTVARAHYIHPLVLDSYVDGSFQQRLRSSAPRRQRILTGSERRLLAFLRVALESELDDSTLQPA